ncbi:MAG: hypothetical protein A3J46_01710 [Candidatus Yanofskybacteria bacterium RIFCSPHIGHO2_02_FULL_41_11]|uniref:Uncharacterized protein n=1 Tax=Candidatus Yanofskybacteria bacterium RIFCSPHIGHO2_02_FULL_41_11 TaxID=1802675 RepID=A0A1F8F8V6_9BACT|nr:MAG: hypothetical protein A3J46_01710 [Candidatus Yanofskybacteria bacterium RIFCSPHIGHO2_02_FULL_41_11]
MIGCKSYLEYNKVMKVTAFLFTAILLLTIPLSVFAVAFSNPFASPFGGRITLVVPCTCSIPPTMLKITVGPPMGGSFLFIPKVSTLYKFYKLLPPSWTLGLSAGRRECLVGLPPACTSAGFGGTIIRMVGTSLF